FVLLTQLRFCFSSYADHPHLHSFPTRRSSDLDHLAAEWPLQHRVLYAGFDRGNILLGNRASGDSVRELEAFTARQGPDFDHHVRSESTRLNSSHVKISYAVFCLKKKKKEQKHA